MLLFSIMFMLEWTKFFKESAIEGFASFIWSTNNNTSFPYKYAPKSFLEDQQNLCSDYNKVILKLKESKNEKQ